MSHAITSPSRSAGQGVGQNIKPGNWRLALYARIERLRLQSEVALTDSNAKQQVKARLDKAWVLVDDPQNLVEAWSGSQVERAWAELRLAEESLVQESTKPADVLANAQAALAHAKSRLPDGDVRVAALTAALGPVGTAPADDQLPAVRAHTLQVTIASHELSDAQHRAQRELRNRLRSITLGLAVLVLGLAITCLFVTVPAGWIPIPKGVAPGHAVAGAVALGAVGALFSAVPSLTQAPANTTTFNPIAEQAMLKIVVGGWSALVGLVAVAAGLQTATGVPDATSPAGFAMMCALFGAMQEAITRFADQKAAETKPATTT